MTLFGVLAFDVLTGMLIGLVLSLLIVVYRASRPNVAQLGRVETRSDGYFDLARRTDAVAVPGIVILRLDQPLWYANALTLRDAALAAAGDVPGTRAVVVDTSIATLDVTTSDVVIELAEKLHERGVDLWISGLHGPARDFAERSGLARALGAGHLPHNLESAVPTAERAPRIVGSESR